LPEQTARVFHAAQKAGLPVKLHADQLSNMHGAKLAADHGALSADHLENTDVDGVAAMARAGTVAVLLPGAFYVLREKRVPPVDALRRQHVPIAIATDSNPGTSPIAQMAQPHHLEHRATGRSRLSNRLQSLACVDLERQMKAAIKLTPGRATRHLACRCGWC
jgi:imidazolonepropionase